MVYDTCKRQEVFLSPAAAFSAVWLTAVPLVAVLLADCSAPMVGGLAEDVPSGEGLCAPMVSFFFSLSSAISFKTLACSYKVNLSYLT